MEDSEPRDILSPAETSVGKSELTDEQERMLSYLKRDEASGSSSVDHDEKKDEDKGAEAKPKKEKTKEERELKKAISESTTYDEVKNAIVRFGKPIDNGKFLVDAAGICNAIDLVQENESWISAIPEGEEGYGIRAAVARIMGRELDEKGRLIKSAPEKKEAKQPNMEIPLRDGSFLMGRVEAQSVSLDSIIVCTEKGRVQIKRSDLLIPEFIHTVGKEADKDLLESMKARSDWGVPIQLRWLDQQPTPANTGPSSPPNAGPMPLPTPESQTFGSPADASELFPPIDFQPPTQGEYKGTKDTSANFAEHPPAEHRVIVDEILEGNRTVEREITINPQDDETTVKPLEIILGNTDSIDGIDNIDAILKKLAHIGSNRAIECLLKMASLTNDVKILNDILTYISAPIKSSRESDPDKATNDRIYAEYESLFKRVKEQGMI